MFYPSTQKLDREEQDGKFTASFNQKGKFCNNKTCFINGNKFVENF